jgi:Multicopper oxidase
VSIRLYMSLPKCPFLTVFASLDTPTYNRHLVRVEYVSRRAIVFDSAADEGGVLAVGTAAAGDGTYIQEQVLVQHDGAVGTGFRVYHARAGAPLGELPEYAYHQPMDVVLALPGEVTTFRAKFDKPGEFIWHCHILSHEDHEMMRPFHVGRLPSRRSWRSFWHS